MRSSLQWFTRCFSYQGKYAEAEASFKTAITQKAGNYPEVHNCLGAALCYQGKYAEAIESYNKALESFTNHNHLHLKTIIQKSLEKVQSVFDKNVSEASAASAKMGLAPEALANKGQKRKADDAEEETSSDTQDMPSPHLILL